MIRGAAAGLAGDRDEFARSYRPLVAGFLARRWHRAPDDDRVEDATQEVLVECFKAGGVLEQIADRAPPTFRAFLFGVVRNVARRRERELQRELASHGDLDLDDSPANDTSMARAFDRAWAEAIVREATARFRRGAERAGADALRRVDLLWLRFGCNRPIRDIATEWDMDPALVHRQYSRARRDFRRALVQAIAFHHPGDPGKARRELRELLSTFGIDPVDAAEVTTLAAAEKRVSTRESTCTNDNTETRP
jgi:RNA polymerase sigma factor (sigma-70 family)